MNPFLIFGIVAGAYLLGRRAKTKQAEVPEPLALPSVEGALQDVDELWAVRDDIEIYPPNATPNFPPPALDGITADAGCNVIAVSDGWWDAMGVRVQALRDTAPGAWPSSADLYTAVVKKYVPTCKGRETVAQKLLRSEVVARIDQIPAVIMNPAVVTARESARRPRRMLGALRGNPRRKPGGLSSRWRRKKPCGTPFECMDECMTTKPCTADQSQDCPVVDADCYNDCEPCPTADPFG